MLRALWCGLQKQQMDDLPLHPRVVSPNSGCPLLCLISSQLGSEQPALLDCTKRVAKWSRVWDPCQVERQGAGNLGL